MRWILNRLFLPGVNTVTCMIYKVSVQRLALNKRRNLLHVVSENKGAARRQII